MPYTAYIDEAGPWLVIEFAGPVDDEVLVEARAAAARLNAEAGVLDFLLDFSEVTSFVLAGEGVERIAEIDRARAGIVTEGRCALVVQRETAEIGTGYLGAVSYLDLDFRRFRQRSDAEAWLGGGLADPPPLPRTRRRGT